MKINHSETVKKCRLINRAELARQCGTHPNIVHYVLHGTYPYMESEIAVRILDKVRSHNLLVEEPESEVRAA